MARFVKYQSTGAFFQPDKQTFDAIEDYIRWAEIETPQRLRKGMNLLVRHMAILNQGEARKMSFGPYDPNQSSPAAAWKIPVRRISGNYYVSWKVRNVAPATWQLYNDSREAYYIEFGINWLGAGRRVRRPIRKLSLRTTLNRMKTTQAYHRIWADIYSSPRRRHRGHGFYQIVQSPGGRWVDMSDREIKSMVRGFDRRGGFLNFRIRHHGGRTQRWRENVGGGGSYSGPMLGRRLPG